MTKWTIDELAYAKGTSEPVRQALLAMHEKLNALKQPEQKPLTTEERNWIVNEALRGHASTRDAIDWVIRQVEQAHGIGEKS